MDWQLITLEELKGLGRRIDYEYLFAPASQEAIDGWGTGPSEELYAKMAALGEGWTNFGGPILHNGELCIVMIKPRDDDETQPH